MLNDYGCVSMRTILIMVGDDIVLEFSLDTLQGGNGLFFSFVGNFFNSFYFVVEGLSIKHMLIYLSFPQFRFITFYFAFFVSSAKKVYCDYRPEFQVHLSSIYLTSI